MQWLLGLDWAKTFGLETPILEILLRGSLMYLGLFVLLRVVLKRQSGAVGITDLLVVVLLADAAQNGLADDYTSISDGLLLVATIVFWSYLLDWLGYRFKPLQQFIFPPPLMLVRNGQMLRHNMRRELISEAELRALLREQGIEDLSTVERAYIEGDGHISAISREQNG